METWKRNLYVIWVAELVAIAGFGVMSSFLPYYVQDLGVTEPQAVKLWSGAVFAVQAVTMTIFAPIWGSVADRYGRKLMVQRAMFGGAIVIALMGFAQNVWQLAGLRAVQGMLTGTVPAATTLVASSAPRQRVGYALGLLQVAIWGGASVGPMLGGFVADAWGYRAPFWVTGVLLFVAGLTVWRFVHEDFQPPRRDRQEPGSSIWEGLHLVAHHRGLLNLFLVRVLGRLAYRTMGPILPLFIQSLVPASTRVASLAGLVSGVGAATSALGAAIIGRISDRVGHRQILLLCSAATALLYVPQFFVTAPWQLIILQAAVGLVMSGVLASLSALLAHLSPEGHEGAVYGVDSSAVSTANALGPMLGASIAAWFGLRAPFLVTAGAFALATGITWKLVPPDRAQASPEPVAAD